MEIKDYLRILAEDIHSVVLSTLDDDGRPVTRAIDIMRWDEKGLYFLTAQGKNFYDQLEDQKFVALTGVKDGRAVSLRGFVECLDGQYLEEIFNTHPYMQKIYPEGTRKVLKVFRLYQAEGMYFDITDPAHVYTDTISYGGARSTAGFYTAGAACIGCGRCAFVCPQNAIDLSTVPVQIDRHHCLRCGQCADACPVGAIARV